MRRVTRVVGQVALVVGGTIGAWAAPAQAQICAPFTDVLASSGFCTNIQWLFNRGITQGCTATQYCPANFVRRDQMAAFLNRMADNLFPLNCATGQVMKWNGTAWACASDAAGPTNAFVQGGNAFGSTATLGTTDNQPVHVIANGQRMIRYEPVAISPNVIGGHFGNGVTAGVRGATIAGGGAAVNTDPDLPSEIPNLVTDHYGTVGGGLANRAGDGAGTTFDGALATVGGGRLNVASGFQSAIGGGLSNAASGAQSTVGGGSNNEAIGTYATVGGGTSNDAIGEHSAVAGGGFNVASGGYATVAGGQFNLAEGDHSFAAGYRAKALGNGSFSFADASEFDFSATTDNAFRVRATGGVIFVTDINLSGTPTWACLTTSGAGWTCASDRRLKQDLALLDGADVLARLARLPLYAWSPKGRNAHVRHYGPMAQDFMAAFGLGEDDTMIGMQDADGVALAAIQGLNAKLEQATSVIGALSARLQALEAWLAAAP